MGTGFFHAASASYYGGISQSGNGIGSVLPFPGMFAIIISPNPIITVLAAVSFMLASLQITCNCYIGMTRVMVGMSLDRTLPAWFSKVSPRFRTPVNAHLIYFLLGVRGDHRLQLRAPSGTRSRSASRSLAAMSLCVSCLAAALLPYRAKALYEAAPGSQYKLAGIPLVTIFGIIGFIFGGAAVVAFLVKPGYGLTGTSPGLTYAIVGGIFVAAVVVLLDRLASTRRARASTSPMPSSKCRRSEVAASLHARGRECRARARRSRPSDAAAGGRPAATDRAASRGAALETRQGPGA